MQNRTVLCCSGVIDTEHKGSSIKDVCTKWRKINLSPSCPHWFNSLTPCPCEHTINFEKSYLFCTKKCGRLHLNNPSLLVRTGQAPPWLRTSFMDGL